MSKDKVAKVTPRAGKKGSRAPRANGKRAVPIHVSQAKVAKMAQEKQTKVIDETTGRAIRQHRAALRELERY